MTYTVYVIPTRGGRRIQVGSYDAEDGQAAIAKAEDTLHKLGSFVTDDACWWAEWSVIGEGKLAYPKPNVKNSA